MEETPAFRRELTSLIRSLRPDVLMTRDPWARYRIHPDHRAVGFTALAAVVTAGNQMLREGPPPHAVSQVYLFQTDNPDFWVDITTPGSRWSQRASDRGSSAQKCARTEVRP